MKKNVSAEELRWGLEELSSEKDQRRVWLANSSDEMSSFDEAVFGMWGDPEAIWQYLLGAVDAAETDRHLAKISTSLARPLIKRHAFLKPRFNRQALADPRFKRMLEQPG